MPKKKKKPSTLSSKKTSDKEISKKLEETKSEITLPLIDNADLEFLGDDLAKNSNKKKKS